MNAATQATDFRARSWLWFRACRKCGGDKYHEDLERRRAAKGIYRPTRLCALCVMAIIMSWPLEGSAA